jgi:hypothetical protein
MKNAQLTHRLQRVLLAGFMTLQAGAQAEAPRLSPAENTTVSPGSSVSISLLLSHADRLTVGKFTVSLASTDPSAPLPTVTAIRTGAAIKAAAMSCASCAPSNGAESLPTFPALPSTTPGEPVTAAFLLSSGGAVGSETGGISGDALEIAQAVITVPADAKPGQTYAVEIKDPDFSDAASQPVEMTFGNGSLTVISPPITLQEGPNTTYHDPARPGNLMIPTAGDDPATPEIEPGFPNDGRVVGNRSYRFSVVASGLAGSGLTWSVTETLLEGTPAPASLQGSILSTLLDGTQAAYTPAEAGMRMASGLNVEITARSDRDPSQSVTFHAVLLPYGDANLDGRVTKEDEELAFRWANGLDLPDSLEGAQAPALIGGVLSPLRRLLADVRPVPGIPVSSSLWTSWTDEWERLGEPLPSQERYNRDGFPFGDGRISLADAQWILQKARFNAASPSQTLDPRISGASAVGF